MADFSTGDAWATKSGFPDFEERDGKNIILARTKVGSDLLNRAIHNQFIEAHQLQINQIQ